MPFDPYFSRVDDDEDDFNNRLESIMGELRSRGYDVRPRKRRTADEQRELYKYGRSSDKPGPIRTEMSGEPGRESLHQSGTAADLDFYDESKSLIRDGNFKGFKEAGEIGENWGLEWGGRWKKERPDDVGPDPAHLQLADLRRLRKKREGNLGSTSPTERIEEREPERFGRKTDINLPPEKKELEDLSSDIKGSVPMSFREAITPKRRRTRDVVLEPDKPLGPEEAPKEIGFTAGNKFEKDPRFDGPFRRERLGDINLPPDMPPTRTGRKTDVNLPPMPKQDLSPRDLPSTRLADLNLDEPIRESNDMHPLPDDPNKRPNIGREQSYQIKDKRTGKSYTWWSDTPPTPRQARRYIYEQEHKSTWDKINEPLTRMPSQAARAIVSGGKQEESPFGIKQKLADILQENPDDSPLKASARGFGRGALTAAGDVTSEMLNAPNVAATLASGGTYGAARAGLGGAAAGFNAVERGIGLAQMAHGGVRAGEGLYEGDYSKAGGGAFEALMGGVQARSPIPYFPEAGPVKTTLGPEIEQGLQRYVDRSPIYEGTVMPPEPGQLGSRGMRRLESMNTMEGEIVPDAPQGPPPPPSGPPRLPGASGTIREPAQRVEPSSGTTYYGGRYGAMGSDINAVESTFEPPRIPDIEPVAPPPPKRGGALKNPATGLERMSDTDLEFAARTGDKAAQLEIRNRAKAAKAASQMDATGLADEGSSLGDIGAPQELVDKLKASLGKKAAPAKEKAPIKNQSDDTVAFLAEQGDTAAIKEARSRPSMKSMWDSIVKANKRAGQTGAVGRGTGRVRRMQAIRSEIRDLEMDIEYKKTTGQNWGRDAADVADLKARLNRMEIDEPLKSKANADDNPVVAKFRAGLDEATNYNDTRFILPDGTKLTHYSSIHEAAANQLGMKLTTAMDNGIVRWSHGGAEIQGPITSKQAEAIIDGAYHNDYGRVYLDVRPQPGQVVHGDYGRGENPDVLRRWVNKQFEDVKPLTDREVLTQNGQWREETVNTMRPEEVKRLADEMRERNYSPGFTEHQGLLDRLAEWNRKKGEGGFINIGRKKTVRPAKDKKPGRFSRVVQPAVGTKYEKPFADWVNQGKAARVEGILKAREFKDLQDLGGDGLKTFVGGSKTGKLNDVHKYFRDKIGELHSKGVNVVRENQKMTDIWENTPDEIRAAYEKMDTPQSFTLGHIVSDLKEGIDAGLTPKFKSIPELIQWYETRANRAISNKQHVKGFIDKGWLKPEGQGGPGWKSVEPYIRSGSKRLTAEPQFEELIRHHLGDESGVNKWMGDFASLGKNLSMSAGIPLPKPGGSFHGVLEPTAINSHGLNMMFRTIIGNPKNALKMGKYLVNPKTAKADLDSILHTAPEAVRNGLTLTTEGYNFGESGGSSNIVSQVFGHRVGKYMEKGLEQTGKLFEDPLFQQVIPAVKLKHYNDLNADFMKGGMSRESAGKAAADFTNNLYGGINWEAMGRSKDLQNLGRAFVLAPDWAETNARLGKGTVASLKDAATPEGKQYRAAVKNLIYAYAAANAINFARSGNLMFQNAPGHTLDIDLGEANGKKVWFRPFGTAADFVRLPFDIVTGAMGEMTGKIEPSDLSQASQMAKNRLSIPAGAGVNILTRRDRYGRPTGARDDYGRPISPGKQAWAMTSEGLSTITPPYLKALGDLALGEIGPLEAAASGFETPLKFSALPRQQGGSGRSRQRRPSR